MEGLLIIGSLMGTGKMVMMGLIASVSVTIAACGTSTADNGVWEIDGERLLFRIVADDELPTHRTAIRRAKEMGRMEVVGNVQVRAEPTEAYPDGQLLARWYPLARVQPESEWADEADGLLPFKYVPFASHVIRDAATGQILEPDRDILSDRSGVEFTRWVEEQEIEQVEILVIEPRERENVTGEHLSSIRAGFDQESPVVFFNMTEEGSRQMRVLTTRNQPRDGKFRLLAIVLDGALHTAPRINSVISDAGVIQGRFTQQEVDELVELVKSGRVRAR